MHSDQQKLELDRNFPLESIFQLKKKRNKPNTVTVRATASLPDPKQKPDFSSSQSLWSGRARY